LKADYWYNASIYLVWYFYDPDMMLVSNPF
jgi:hypothetical protein